MKITVSTKSKKWTDFEKKEWKKADTEHYGKPLKWDKRAFKISAREGLKLIGILRMNVKEGVAFIDALIVAEEYRGKTVGEQLMQRAEQIALENKAHKIYLQTGKKWKSLPFYLKLGYKITSNLPNHYFHTDFVELTKYI